MLGDLKHADAPRCGLSEAVASVRSRLAASGWEWCAVVNYEGVVLGRLRSDRLADASGSAESVMEPGPSTYRPNVPVQEMAERLRKVQAELAFVTDPDGRFLGTARRPEIEAAARSLKAAG